ncbi:MULTISPECIES: hypothetical protein [Luteibacter]|uniref:hypothetical protein n=1 Tax=Luteibacter TaxID=242605 RepID=UPI00056D6C37|nr:MULTISPECIES: hypothetical protein [unclassified Luteibacter]
MSKTPTRIYAVKHQSEKGPRLVRATSQAAALRHVAMDEYQIRVASQDDLVIALHDGAEVETASVTTESEPA